MDKREYSRPLDVHRISEHPKVQQVIEVLFGELQISGHLGKSSKKKIVKHLKAIVLDLYIGYSFDPHIYIGYPRARSQYSKGQSVRKVVLWVPAYDEGGGWSGGFGLSREP